MLNLSKPNWSEVLLMRTMFFLKAIAQQGVIATVRKLMIQYIIRGIRLSRNVCLFIRWRLSPKIAEEALSAREEECNGCDDLEVAKFKDGSGRFCKACGCPKTRWAELSVKNSREEHNCPTGKHVGSKRDHFMMAFGGCKGCQAGKQKDREPGEPTTRDLNKPCPSCGKGRPGVHQVADDDSEKRNGQRKDAMPVVAGNQGHGHGGK